MACWGRIPTISLFPRSLSDELQLHGALLRRPPPVNPRAPPATRPRAIHMRVSSLAHLRLRQGHARAGLRWDLGSQTNCRLAFLYCFLAMLFAISHRLVRGDTVAGLALKYSVQVIDIKRLNNMMSDHGIYSRERLLIPITKPELLSGATCYVELDEHAKREVAVLYLDGGPSDQLNSHAGNIITDADRRNKKILDSVRRSLHVDDGTAEYYLSVANGDPRAAMMQYSEDLRWEQQSAHM